MKKLILIVLVLFFSQFQLTFKEAEASYNSNYNIKTSIENYDGMSYRVFVYEGYAGAPGGVHVINVTKEKLEVERLKLEIQKLRK